MGSGCGWFPAEHGITQTVAVVLWRPWQQEGSLTPAQHPQLVWGQPWGCQGPAPPHLKGYPNWMLMAVIPPLSHFTVAPVSPLKEPQEPKAKMAKSYRRGQWVGGLRPWGAFHPWGAGCIPWH